MSNLETFLSDKCSTAPPARKSLSTSGKILIGLTGGLGLGFTIICAPFVAPAFRKYCLPFVPATNNQMDNILSVLRQGQPVAKLLDIGSGDGRIVIAAAKLGYTAHGVELNPWLVQYSRVAALANGCSRKSAFFRKNLWHYDVSAYKYVVIFGVEQMMSELEKKLKNEMMPDSKIIVCRFPLPTLKADTIVGQGIDRVWIYDLGKR